MKVLLNQTVALIGNIVMKKQEFYMLWYKMNHMMESLNFFAFEKEKKRKTEKILRWKIIMNDRESGK